MRQEFPNWAEFTPRQAEEKIPQLLQGAEAELSRLEQANADSFEALVWRLNDLCRELYSEWGKLGHTMGVMNSDEWRKVHDALQPAIVAFSLRVGQSKAIYAAAKRLLAAGGLTGVRRRILEKMVQNAELAGVGLDGDKRERFNHISARLAQLSSDFYNAVIDATKAFKLEKNGVTYTIDDAAYTETMKHCQDREVRERLYRARATRAPENATRISEILALRKEMASLLGYPDYASLSLATKCAPSVSAVFGMVDQLDAATAAIADQELAELGDNDLQPWDVAFAAERLREKKYAYSEDELKKFFELEDVMSGLWKITKFLFGVEVAEITGDAKPSVWHDDVRVFEVRSSGSPIANFYFDPFVRSGQKGGGAWMNEFHNRRVRNADVLMPLAVVVTNFPKKGSDGRCLLPFREVETLFHEFGHALQCMLTMVDDEDAAGVSMVEWDAVEVASQFMENWCLDERTGITIPRELFEKVKKAKNFRAASACRRQLSFAKMDMLLHGAELPADPNAVKNSVFQHFGMPFLPDDGFLNAFSHIFAGGYAAGYYGYKWAEVMSADCYGAFEEAGLNDDAAIAAVGSRYRDTILALGGSENALSVFRRFRGRDPEIDALLRQQGLKK